MHDGFFKLYFAYWQSTQDFVMAGTIQQRKWTEQELRAAGFSHYYRKKEVVLARQLTAKEAPLRIRTYAGDELIAPAGYIVCYLPGSQRMQHIRDYEHWPVEPSIFQQTYQVWDVLDWQPSPAQKHLIEHGCRPFYKAAGIWAKRLEEDVYIQGLEHEKPVLLRQNQILAIGQQGEPYHIGEEAFHSRYETNIENKPLRGIVGRLVRFFKGGN
jgi:hypothetical protein